MAKQQRSKRDRWSSKSVKSLHPAITPSQQGAAARQIIERSKSACSTVAFKVACYVITMFNANPARFGSTRIQVAKQLALEGARSILNGDEAKDIASIREGVRIGGDALWAVGNRLRSR